MLPFWASCRPDQWEVRLFLESSFSDTKGISRTPYLELTYLQKAGKMAYKKNKPLINIVVCYIWWDFPGGSDQKESACKARNMGSVPGLGRSPGKGNGYPHQYSCLENSTDRGVWQATVHRVTRNQTRLKQLSTHTHAFHGMHVLWLTAHTWLLTKWRTIWVSFEGPLSCFQFGATVNKAAIDNHAQVSMWT